MSREKDGEGMQKREAVEALETVELRRQAATTREQEQCSTDEEEQAGQEEQGAALAVLLGQMVAYLSSKVDANDLDIVSFSLHHLFCGFDSLYRVRLPSFVVSLAPRAPEVGEETDAQYRQLHLVTWLQLQALRQVVRRMQPLCQLLSEVGESVLGQLGYRESREDEGSYVAASAGVEQALQDLATSLTCWQQRYRGLPSFRSLLYVLFPTIPLPLQLDAPFTQLLEYASTLFGDILPAFHALSTGDDEAVILLLFDLLQQIDLLAVECETLLELFHLLLQQHMVAVT